MKKKSSCPEEFRWQEVIFQFCLVQSSQAVVALCYAGLFLSIPAVTFRCWPSVQDPIKLDVFLCFQNTKISFKWAKMYFTPVLENPHEWKRPCWSQPPQQASRECGEERDSLVENTRHPSVPRSPALLPMQTPAQNDVMQPRSRLWNGLCFMHAFFKHIQNCKS